MAKASSFVLEISSLEIFEVKAQNKGDRLSYDTKLEIGCCVHDLTPFLRAIGSSNLSKIVLELPEDEESVSNTGLDSGQCLAFMSGLNPISESKHVNLVDLLELDFRLFQGLVQLVNVMAQVVYRKEGEWTQVKEQQQ